MDLTVVNLNMALSLSDAFLGLRVVFVDDEEANIRLAMRSLKKLGVQQQNMTFFKNGELAGSGNGWWVVGGLVDGG